MFEGLILLVDLTEDALGNIILDALSHSLHLVPVGVRVSAYVLGHLGV